ncbi:MAG: hypothetical protein GC168_02480 [Candidatus Hydrogenedens sp.]|nr:hypothetical protein [Candidatus Hydrogenedens sp.]
MKRSFIVLGALAGCVYPALAQIPYTPDAETAAIFARFDATPYEAPAPLPPLHPGVCSLAPELDDTITELGDDTFYSLFQADTLAQGVVDTWAKHAAGHLFSSELQALSDAIKVAEGAAPVAAFRDIVAFHLSGDAPGHPINQALDRLVQAGFRFPLFVTDFGNYALADRMEFLVDFRQSHTGRRTGGFGSLTMRDFAHTPADPAAFSFVQVDRYILSARQYGILPELELGECPTPEELAEMGITSLSGSNMCCCNDPTHGAYRSCVSNTGTVCSMCGSYCCLIGVQKCPSGHTD